MTLTPVRIVEAALFSAGKPLLVEEIAEATRLPADQVKEALKDLQKEYATRESALEVGRAGQKWAMQIRTEYAERAKHLASMEIPAKVLRTLALIAFHQPVKQSDLKDMVGSVVYDHVGELHERGMITVRQDGITKVLATTERFLEYFGIDATDRDGIRNFLASKVGVVLKPKEAQQSLPGGDTPPKGPEAAPLEAPAAAPSQPL